MKYTNTSYRTRPTAAALTALLAIGGFQTLAALDHHGAMAETETGASLNLNVTGYDAPTGQIMVALYKTEAAFDAESNPFRDAKVTVSGATTTVTFDGLSAGEYAFKLFHDANGNGELDTDGLGIPSEDYYFSTDASDPFSAPEWGESKFALPAGHTTRDIDLD